MSDLNQRVRTKPPAGAVSSAQKGPKRQKSILLLVLVVVVLLTVFSFFRYKPRRATRVLKGDAAAASSVMASDAEDALTVEPDDGIGSEVNPENDSDQSSELPQSSIKKARHIFPRLAPT